MTYDRDRERAQDAELAAITRERDRLEGALAASTERANAARAEASDLRDRYAELQQAAGDLLDCLASPHQVLVQPARDSAESRVRRALDELGSHPVHSTAVPRRGFRS